MQTIEERTDTVLDARQLLTALNAFKKGDFSVRLDFGKNGLAKKVADAFNDIIERNEKLVGELERISQVVGTEGQLTQRASLDNVSGSWAQALDSINTLISNLVRPTAETARVIGAVAKGDLSQPMSLEINDRPLQGEFLRTAKTVNRVVSQLDSFASEVTRVASEAGTDDKLVVAARVKSAAGTWKELTKSVNHLAANLTAQHRAFAELERKNGDVEQAHRALEEKAKQLALTSSYKSEFLANMSHELRTPLNSLLILSDQLSKNSDGNLTPRQTEYAQTIHSSGNDLLTLINDILDLSKIESGTVVLDIGEAHFSDLHGLLERTFRHVAEAKGVDFSIHVAPDLPPTMQTDTKRVQQVLKNLLSNAFKFTHRGRVSLDVRVAGAGWSSDNETLNGADAVLAFSVTDTGIGIPLDKQQSIFEAFRQADGSTSRKYGGTGLGLAISRELARLLDGEIRLVSMPGAGSTFSLYLPMSYETPNRIGRLAMTEPNAVSECEAELDAGLRQSEQPSANIEDDAMTERLTRSESLRQVQSPDRLPDEDNDVLNGRRVLIVDDDIRNIFALTSVLERYNMHIVSAETGRDAIQILQDTPDIDAVLMDIMMPEFDGLDTTRAIREIPDFKELPIIAVTAKAMKGDREKCIEAGAWDYLSKPVNPEQMLAVLREWIRR
jgi:signal transduction histidine kinase